MTHPEQPGNWSDQTWPTVPAAPPDSDAPTVPVAGHGHAQPGPGYAGPDYAQPGPGYAGPDYAQPGPGYAGPDYAQPGPGYAGPSYAQPGPSYAQPEQAGQAVGPPGYVVPGYPPYGYGGPQYGYGAPPAQTTNGLAVASLVCALAGLLTCGVASLVGAILGHVAKRQIRERGEGGAGLANAGIIVGWIVFALGALILIAYFVLVVWAVNHASDIESPTPTFS